MAEKSGDIPNQDYFRVKNDWFDALIAYRIPGEQMQILLYIIRKTYGWRQKKAKITLTEFEKATGIRRRSISRGLQALRQKNIIGVKKDTSKRVTYWFNKYYNTWLTGVKKAATAPTGVKKADVTGVKKDTHTFKEQLNNSTGVKKAAKEKEYWQLTEEEKRWEDSRVFQERHQKYLEKNRITG